MAIGFVMSGLLYSMACPTSRLGYVIADPGVAAERWCAAEIDQQTGDMRFEE